jgi:hypothetical protein
MSRRARVVVYVLLFTLSLIALTSCGGGSKPALAVALSQSAAQTLQGNGTLALTATVTNDSTGGGVTWGISPVTGCGTLSTMTSASVIYTAPASSALTASCTATITATSSTNSSKSASVQVTVNPVSVAIGGGAAQSAIAGGSTLALSATVTNDPASGGVTWSLSPAGCGTLSASTGMSVTYTPPAASANAACTATVTATSVSDNTKKSTVTITVTLPPITLSLLPSTAQILKAGGALTLNASIGNDFASKGVAWSVSPATSCGSVSGSGMSATYTAPTVLASACTATVKVTAVGDTTKTASVTATVNPISVTLAPNSAQTLMAGQTLALTGTVNNDGTNSGLTWTVAPASGCGTLSATTGTSVTYTAPSSASLTAACTATVTTASTADPSKSASAQVTVNPISVALTGSKQLSAIASEATIPLAATLTNDPANAGLTWSVSPNGCGTLSATTGTSVTYTPPVASANAACTATVTVTSTSDGTKKDAATVTVTLPPITLSLSPSTPQTVQAGGTLSSLSATIGNDFANQGVTWSVSPVSGCGSIVGSGTTATYTAPIVLTSTCTATLKVTAVGDATKNASVTATVNPIAVVVSPNTPQTLKVGQSLVLTGSIANDGTNSGLSWSVAPPSGCGALSASTGTSVTYTAPASLATTCVATVTVASTADNSKTASVAATVNPISVAITPNSVANVPVGGTQNLSASVTNDFANAGVIWSSGGCGTLSGSTTTATTYTAPVTLASACTATVTATSVSDPGKSSSVQLPVNPISVTLSPLGPLTLGAGATQNVQAAVANDGTGQGVNWSLSSGCGSLSGTTPNATTYNAPAVVTTPCDVTLTAASQADGTITSQLSITVSGSGNSAVVSGIAAKGAPIAGASVTLKDSAGNTSTTTTAADGSFSLNSSGFIPPFLLQVQTATGSLYSVSADASVSTTINVHPYSDLVVRSWYSAQGVPVDTAFADPMSTPAPDPSTVQILQNTVTSMSQLWLNNAGVDTTQFNLISGSFTANGAGLDQVLDQTTVNLSNPAAPAVTITDGTTTQTSTIAYDTNTSAVNVLSTTQNTNGMSVSTVTAVVPTQSAQQTVLNSINATVTGFITQVNNKGTLLTGDDLLPYLAADLVQDGMNQAQYAAQLASELQVHGTPIASAQIQTINNMDGQTADIVFGINKTQNGVTKTIPRELWFENSGGTWLIAGDRKYVGIQIRSEMRTYEGTEFGYNGPSLSAIVVAPAGTVQGATVTGGGIWNANPLPQLATIVQQPVNLDQFILMQSPLASNPPVGTLFDIAVTPTSGPVVHYSVPSNAFSTENIRIVSPTDSSLAGANLGQPLQVSWTLPTTFVVAQLGLTAEAFGGNVSNPGTPACLVSPAQPLATNATSATITVPATCDGQPVQYVTVGITATGSENQNSFAIMGFGNANGDSGSFSITTPSLPNGSVTSVYSQTLQTLGGTAPISWSVIAGSLPAGLTLDPNSGVISGTPTASGVTSNFTVQATDSSSPNQTATSALTIQINAVSGFNVNGQVTLANSGGPNGPSGVPGITVTLGTSPVQTTTTNSSGNFSFSGVSNGPYTVTLSLPGAVVYPASQTVTVNGADASLNFQVALGYTVTGTVAYTGSKTGTIYISLQSNNNTCNGASFGTSIASSTLSSGGNFTISGVCPGTYSMSAWMDTIGLAVPNGSDPSGTISSVTVPTSANPAVTLSGQSNNFNGVNGPKLQGISPMSGGVVLQFNPVTNSNGVEMPPRYRVQWSTDSTFATGMNQTVVLATGGKQPYILSSRTGLIGLTDTSKLYFQIRGESIDGTTATTNWTTTPNTVTIGAITPASPVTVTGIVNYTGAATTGPLYVGCYDQNTNNVYGESFASGSFPQPYSVAVSSGANCFMFGIIDNNNNSSIDPGDVSNTQGNGAGLVVTGPGPIPDDINLPSSNSTVSLTTSHSQWPNGSGGTNDNYNLSFDLRAGIKLPVAVQLVSGPNVLVPMDIAPQQGSKGGEFQFWLNIGGTRPTLGDVYGLEVTYSDGKSEAVNATVTTVLDAFAQNLTVDTTTSPATPTKPTFLWAAPANPPAGGYTYQFWIGPQNGGNSIWQVPGNNSNVNGLASSVTSLIWGVDPNDGTNTPTVSSLPGATTYNWTVTVQDSNGNSAQEQVSYVLP